MGNRLLNWILQHVIVLERKGKRSLGLLIGNLLKSFYLLGKKLEMTKILRKYTLTILSARNLECLIIISDRLTRETKLVDTK